MLRAIAAYILKNLLAIHNGSAVVKLKSLLMLSLPLSALASVNPIAHWIDANIAYIGFVLVAIAIDHILGSAVHAFVKRDFTPKKNIIGLAVKLSLVLSVGILFEGFQFLYPEKTPFIEAAMDYLLTITRIMVFLYPAGSAFVNASILTNGKFPPLGWIKKVEKFNSNLDINQFKEEKDEGTEDFSEPQ
jgi:hypothetical protein